jgi:hypothetical protein
MDSMTGIPCDLRGHVPTRFRELELAVIAVAHQLARRGRPAAMILPEYRELHTDTRLKTLPRIVGAAVLRDGNGFGALQRRIALPARALSEAAQTMAPFLGGRWAEVPIREHVHDGRNGTV